MIKHPEIAAGIAKSNPRLKNRPLLARSFSLSFATHAGQAITD
jgi:hypothetical protein